jgi:hypothetical protein
VLKNNLKIFIMSEKKEIDYVSKLKNVKKMNKIAREVNAIRNGFISFEKYVVYLEGKIAHKPVIKPFIKSKKTKNEKVSSNLTDLVIAFDTTGSMTSYINEVKKHVSDLIPNLFAQNPGLNISIVAFGDYCDKKDLQIFGKAYQVIDLTSNEKNLIEFVKNAEKTSGGDADEFYELVIKKITEETSWRDKSNKSVLFIGDCGPHPVGYTHYLLEGSNQINWIEECKKAAGLNILFDTLTIGNTNVNFYKEISNITGGICLPFSNSAKTSKVVEATALFRGGSSTNTAFMARSTSDEVTSDPELNAVYSMYKTVKK